MTRGMTLLEVLVVLAVLGILFAISAPFLIGWVQSLRARENASQIVAMISDAKLRARGDNKTVKFVLDPTSRTVTLQRDGATLQTQTLEADLSCVQVRTGSGVTCDATNDLNINAPYGTFETSPAAIQVTYGSKSVSVYVIGVTGKLVVR